MLILPEYNAYWPVPLQEQWLSVARRIDVRGDTPTVVDAEAERDLAQLVEAIRKQDGIVRFYRKPVRVERREEPTMTTVARATITPIEAPPPPPPIEKDFATNLRALADALRTERARALSERERIDARVREVDAELAALDAAERTYRQRVERATRPTVRALPAPRGPMANLKSQTADAPRRTHRTSEQEYRDRVNEANGRPTQAERERLVSEWLDAHDGELVIGDLARSIGVFPTTFNQECRSLAAEGKVEKIGQGHYRRVES